MENAPKTVFRRYEKKYLLDMSKAAEFLSSISEHTVPDRYRSYTISNLYFDTDDYRIIVNSLEKPVYKEKLRLRAYGVPCGTDAVFLELKKKYKGTVYKRRITLTLEEAQRYIYEGKTPLLCGENQIFREIDYFKSYFRPTPKVYIAYDRTALDGVSEPELRITLDRNIRFRTDALSLSAGDFGTPVLPPEKTVLEIKTPDAYPLWLARAISELELKSTSFSKYGTVYSEFLMKYLVKGSVFSA